MKGPKLIFLILIALVIVLSIDGLANQQLFVYSPYFMLVFLCSWILLLSYNTRKGWFKSEKSSPVDATAQLEPQWISLLLLVSSVVLTVSIVSVRFLHFPGAQGADVPDYIFYTSLWIRGIVRLDTFIALRGLTLVVILLIRQAVESVLRLSYDASFMIIPLVLVILHCFAVYRFTRVGAYSRLIGSLAAALTPVTFLTIRLSYDLFSNLLGLIFTVLFFSFYLENLRGGTDRKNTLVSGILLVLVLLSHVATYVFVIQALAIFAVFQKLFRKDASKKAAITLKILGPSLVLAGLVFAYFSFARGIVNRPLVADVLDFFTGGELRLFSPASGWSQLALNESALFLFLSILGMISLLKNRDDFSGLLIAWVAMVFIYVMVWSYQESYRMLLYLPTMIFAALGLSSLLKLSDSHLQNVSRTSEIGVRKIKLDKKVLKTSLVLLVFTSLIVSASSRAYIPYWSYERPSRELESQLEWITQTYGYGNDKVLVLAEYDENHNPNLRRWIRAFTGNDVYVGELIRFLSGQPDWLVSGSSAAWLGKSMNALYRSNLSQYSVIIMPEAIYSVEQFEQSVSNKVDGRNIYVFQIHVVLQPSPCRKIGLLVQGDDGNLPGAYNVQTDLIRLVK